MQQNFRLVMISAMYENGGNTTHRFLDGHSQLAVYPFESQLGTHLVTDAYSSLFPKKYRWPEFSLSGCWQQDYQAIIDEEYKVRTRTPRVSKFRHVEFDADDNLRLASFLELTRSHTRSRAAAVEAFFRATFQTWQNYAVAGPFKAYVGYSPVLVVDAEKIIADFPDAIVLHVVRNPFSAYADTKRRPVPLPLAQYVTLWSLNQYFALTFQKRHPQNVLILRLEDLLADPQKALAPLCKQLNISLEPALLQPTWNSHELPEVYPWGTIRRATPEANEQTAQELSAAERDEVATRAEPFLSLLGYGQ